MAYIRCTQSYFNSAGNQAMMSIHKIFTAVMVVAAISLPGYALGGHGHAKIKIENLKQGDGAVAVRHSKVAVHYTGWLMDGTKFDSSLDRGKPFEFTLGAGQVIPGWDMGVEGMKVGGKRQLIIPPDLAYGKKGAGGVIPANATLKFEVALLSLTAPKYSNIDNAALKALLKRGTKIVDIRRKDEWDKTGVIEGSQRLTAFDGNGNFVRSFPASLKKIAGPGDEVILICRTGSRSSTLANMLAEQAGYTKVYNVKDGMVKWLKDSNPVVK